MSDPKVTVSLEYEELGLADMSSVLGELEEVFREVTLAENRRLSDLKKETLNPTDARRLYFREISALKVENLSSASPEITLVATFSSWLTANPTVGAAVILGASYIICTLIKSVTRLIMLSKTEEVSKQWPEQPSEPSAPNAVDHGTRLATLIGKMKKSHVSFEDESGNSIEIRWERVE